MRCRRGPRSKRDRARRCWAAGHAVRPGRASVECSESIHSARNVRPASGSVEELGPVLGARVSRPSTSSITAIVPFILGLGVTVRNGPSKSCSRMASRPLRLWSQRAARPPRRGREGGGGRALRRARSVAGGLPRHAATGLSCSVCADGLGAHTILSGTGRRWTTQNSGLSSVSRC